MAPESMRATPLPKERWAGTPPPPRVLWEGGRAPNRVPARRLSLPHHQADPCSALEEAGTPQPWGLWGPGRGAVRTVAPTLPSWLAAPGALPSDPVLSPGVDRKKPRKRWEARLAVRREGGVDKPRGRPVMGQGLGSPVYTAVGGWAAGRAETGPPTAASLPGSLLSARHFLNTMGFPGLGCKSLGWGGQPTGSIWWVGRRPRPRSGLDPAECLQHESLMLSNWFRKESSVSSIFVLFVSASFKTKGKRFAPWSE